MKARVKATGEIVEISEDCSCVYAEHFDKSYNINEEEGAWIATDGKVVELPKGSIRKLLGKNMDNDDLRKI